MAAKRVQCLACHFPIEVEESPEWLEHACPSCQARQSAMVFPAIRGISMEVPKEDPAVIDGIASCFFHAAKPAQIPCDLCGRFLCSLCDLNIDNRHLCTLCLQAAQDGKSPAGKPPVAQVKESVFIPQNLAMMFSFYAPLSIFGLYVLFITAPVAMFVSIRYWNHPGGIQQRGKWRYVLSLVLAVLQIFLMIGIVLLIIWARKKASLK